MRRFILLLLVLTQIANAEEFTSRIHSISEGARKQSPLVRFDNGRVTFLSSRKDKLLEALKKSLEAEEEVSVDVDRNNFLIDAQPTDGESNIEDETNPSQPFTPAVMKTSSAALKVFKKMKRNFRSGGQCYNRAHIWSYEEFKRSGLNSMKIFMFFTERYIRKYKYHWWFHVTPMVYVGSSKKPMTLDRRYTSGPRTTKSWSDIFIKSKRTCPKVDTFNEFWLNQKTQDCYHIHTSMYYVIPRDIEKRDLTGEERVEFREKDIKKAYKDAFKGYR